LAPSPSAVTLFDAWSLVSLSYGFLDGSAKI